MYQNLEDRLASMLVSLEELNTIEARGMFGRDQYSNYGELWNSLEKTSPTVLAEN